MRLSPAVVAGLLAVLPAAACTADEPPSQAEVEDRLAGAEELAERDVPGDWHGNGELATEVGGGFCRLPELVDASSPAARTRQLLVDGEVLLRQTVLGYADEDTAAEVLAGIEERLAACGEDEEARELGLTTRPLDEEGEQVGFRLAVEVAGVPLVMDTVAWRDGRLVDMVRLNYPAGHLDDPEQLREQVVAAVREG